MSDIHNADAGGDPQAEAMVDAHFRGDKAEAQRIFNERNDEVSPIPPGEVPAPLANELRSDAAAMLSEMPGGNELVREWGGADSENFSANFGYAHAAAQHVQVVAPEVFKFFTQEIEMPDGSTYCPGDDPAMIKLAAQVGRLLAHRDGREILPVNTQRNAPGRPQPPSAQKRDSIQEQIDAVFKKHPVGSDEYKSRKVQAELDRLFASMGNQPIVGNGGRSV